MRKDALESCYNLRLVRVEKGCQVDAKKYVGKKVKVRREL